MPELGSGELILRLVLAAALGGAVGAERELRDREAGFRTHLLVCLGAALFTLVSAYAWSDWSFSTQGGVVLDPTRIAAQIVSGIGFLGAGAIIRQGLSVRGLTTAATLWAVAAIGMASATGYYAAAVATTLLVLVTLGPLRTLAHRVFGRLRAEGGRVVVDLRPGAGAAPILDALEAAGAQTRSLEFQEVEGKRRVTVDVELGAGAAPAAVVGRLMDADGVLGAEWTE